MHNFSYSYIHVRLLVVCGLLAMKLSFAIDGEEDKEEVGKHVEIESFVQESDYLEGEELDAVVDMKALILVQFDFARVGYGYLEL